MSHEELLIPTIHLNGSSAEHLLEIYNEACDKVWAALRSMPSPNARDYYPQGPDAYQKAEAQHREIGVALALVHAKLVFIRGGIVEQCDARPGRR